MESCEKDRRLHLVTQLGEIAEGILRQYDAFSGIPFQDEVTSYIFRKYLHYYDSIDQEFGQKVLKSEVDFAKYLIADEIIGEEVAFAIMHPEHIKTQKQFASWVRDNEKDSSITSGMLNGSDDGRIDFKRKLEEVFNNRKVDLQAEKKISSGMYTYSKKVDKDHKIFILFDKGVRRDFFSLYVGLTNPKIYFDVGYLFANAQSRYPCKNGEVLERAVGKAVDLFAALMPFLLKLQ